MNILKVPYLPHARYKDPIFSAKDFFPENKPGKLAYQPWQPQPLAAEVTFNISYGDDAIFLKFNVKEKYFKAVYRQTNEPVYKDSCVEFFIGFDENGTYYNFEFNAIGTRLAAYGSSDKRGQLPVRLVDTIKCTATHKTTPGNPLPVEWELTAVIPFEVFYKHAISSLKGKTCKANFYKCGDDLPEPHFLCWNNIVADTPNFHLPRFFGALIFE
jgi:hypothetical protein